MLDYSKIQMTFTYFSRQDSFNIFNATIKESTQEVRQNQHGIAMLRKAAAVHPG